jgi:hypothetical protein
MAFPELSFITRRTRDTSRPGLHGRDLERGLAQHEPFIPGLSRPMSLPVRGSVLFLFARYDKKPALGCFSSFG